MNKKHLLAAIVAFAFTVPAAAQTESPTLKSKTIKPFNNLELTINAGTTGIGFDLATYVHKIVRLRTGFDFMPRWDYTMHFAIAAGRYDENGNWIASDFNQMADKLEQITGYEADDNVAMTGEPTFDNFKFMADIFPFRNKHWHVTAGFYWGRANVAKAYNKTEEMPSLLAVSMYNHIYDKVLAGEPIYGDNIYLDPDLEDMMLEFGRMGINVGTMKSTGQAYMMEPDENSMVKANIKVNNFRPYLGFGYSGRLIKNDDRYHIGFECGAMFWGGTPAIITHDGTNLSTDVRDIYYSVGDYVDIIKVFKVYPVLNLRLTRKIF